MKGANISILGNVNPEVRWNLQRDINEIQQKVLIIFVLCHASNPGSCKQNRAFAKIYPKNDTKYFLNEVKKYNSNLKTSSIS